MEEASDFEQSQYASMIHPETKSFSGGSILASVQKKSVLLCKSEIFAYKEGPQAYDEKEDSDDSDRYIVTEQYADDVEITPFRSYQALPDPTDANLGINEPKQSKSSSFLEDSKKQRKI